MPLNSRGIEKIAEGLLNIVVWQWHWGCMCRVPLFHICLCGNKEYKSIVKWYINCTFVTKCFLALARNNSFPIFMWNVNPLINEKPIPNITHYLIACILYVLYIRSDNQVSLYLVAPSWKERCVCRRMIAHWRRFVWLWENLEWIILHNRVKVWKIFCCNKRWRQKRCHFSLVLRDLFLSKISYFLFSNVSNKMLYNWCYTKYKKYDNFYWLSCCYLY